MVEHATIAVLIVLVALEKYRIHSLQNRLHDAAERLNSNSRSERKVCNEL